MCEHHNIYHILSPQYDFIPMEFVSGFVYSLTLARSLSWFRVNDILFITAMDIWASCETYNSFSIFRYSPPSLRHAEIQVKRETKTNIEWNEERRFLNFNERKSAAVRYCLNLGWLVVFFFWLLCPQLFCNFYINMGICVRTCQCFHFHCVSNVSILVRILFTTFFLAVGFYLNLLQKNI